MDRSAINRALAKAMAHRATGNHDLADQWAAHLVFLLDAAGILAECDARRGAIKAPTR